MAVASLLTLAAPGLAASWTSITPLPDGYNSHTLSYASGYLYNIGGADNSNGEQDGTNVLYAQVHNDGTIGQPDAGVAMSGGNFSVSGGFWSLIAVVQTAGAPLLTITHSGNSVIISWPSPSTGFVLQQNSNLATTNWTTSGVISDDGTNKSITITSPTGNLFFRLQSQ